MNGKRAIVELSDINKFFIHSHAVDNLNLSIYAGETLGIVGHNGAGKSTLVNILTGTYLQSSGTIYIDGKALDESYDVQAANALGIRAVFQELSLCPNLSVVENMRVFHPAVGGFGWQKRLGEMILATLDRIFPNHGIRASDAVENLSLGSARWSR